jgi:hypothetical protein
MTASCQSNGSASLRLQLRQYSTVCSSKCRAVSASPSDSVSSGPSSRLIGSSRLNAVSAST